LQDLQIGGLPESTDPDPPRNLARSCKPDTMEMHMRIAVDISLYPLDADFIPPIQDFIERLNARPGCASRPTR